MKEGTKLFWKSILAELFGTMILMYGVMAISLNLTKLNKQGRITLDAENNPAIYCLGVSFIVLAVVYCFADVSGAHFNPAVTLATVIRRKLSFFKGGLYIVAQCIGSTLATLLAVASFPHLNAAASSLVVGVVLDVNIGEAFLMELMLTFILIYVVCATALDTPTPKQNKLKVSEENGGGKDEYVVYNVAADTKSGFAPLAIAFTAGVLCVVGSSVSMSVFNPSRAFGPGLVANKWTNQWIYWLADYLGAGLACYTQKFFSHNDDSLLSIRNFLHRVS